MNFRILAGTAAALSLATITGASAQTYITEPGYVIETPPTYVAPAVPAPRYVPVPGYMVSEPGYVVEAPPATVMTPRYRYGLTTSPRSEYYDATYSDRATCAVDAWGNQYCD